MLNYISLYITLILFFSQQILASEKPSHEDYSLKNSLSVTSSKKNESELSLEQARRILVNCSFDSEVNVRTVVVDFITTCLDYYMISTDLDLRKAKQNFLEKEVYKCAIALLENPKADEKISTIENNLRSFKNLVTQFSAETKKIDSELRELR
ncbi:hypothetical protein IM40_06910 [Candidatus Paracaedimonas acanthamoebae]|nr:hypothetical protein IM40_06910 [Candidatus Paracaedimonas acanthamoebae]